MKFEHRERVGTKPRPGHRSIEVKAQVGTAWFQTLIVVVQQGPVLSWPRAQHA